MALDDDIRHSERNDSARQRVADQLSPAINKLLAKWLEIDEDELPFARDAIKDVMRARRLRQERTEKAMGELIMASLKWIAGIAVGGLAGWFSAHQGSGK